MKFNIKKAFKDIFQNENFFKKMFMLSSFLLISLILGFFRSYCISPLYYEELSNKIYLASLNFTPASLTSFLGFPSVTSYLTSFDIGQLLTGNITTEKIYAVFVIIFASLFTSVVMGYFVLNSHNKIIQDDDEDEEIDNNIVQYFKKGFLCLIGCIIVTIPFLIINLMLYKFIYQYFNELREQYYDISWLFGRFEPFIVYIFTAIISFFIFLYLSACLIPYTCNLRFGSFFNFKKVFKIIFQNFKPYLKYLCFLVLFNILFAFMIYVANCIFSIIIEFEYIKIPIESMFGAENIVSLSLALLLILILLPFLFINITFVSNLQTQFITYLIKKENNEDNEEQEDTEIEYKKKSSNKIIKLITAIVVIIAISIGSIYVVDLYKTKTTVLKYINSLNFYGLMFKYARDDYGDLDSWNTNNAEEFFNKIKEYLPIDKVCGEKDNDHICFNEKYSKLNKDGEIDIFKKRFYKFSLKDGSTGAIYYNFPKCDIDDSKSHQPPLNALCGSLWFDINGKKKPNVYGKDLFQLLITKSGELVPRGHEDDRVYSIEHHCSNMNQSGDACGAWILYNNNMDYLKRK